LTGWLLAGLFLTTILAAHSFLAAQALLQQPTEPAEGLRPAALVPVHGLVRDAVTGQPLARALVAIEGEAGTGVLTDGEGRFELPSVATGPHIFRVKKPGYHDRPYASEEENLEDDGPAHSVFVAAEMPELAFSLTPASAIQGHIELSSGDPALGIGVVLLKQVIRQGRALWAQVSMARSNGNGNYRFGGLPEGLYAVYTQPSLESEPAFGAVAAGAKGPRSGYPSVFFPDARDFAGASRIRLEAGQQASANFNLAVEPFYTVTAIGLFQTPGKPAAPPSKAYTASVLDPSGHLLPYIAQYDDASHQIQATLPDGSYTLLVRGMARPNFLGDTIPISAAESRSAGAFVGAIDVTVDEHPISGLRVPLGSPHSNSVRLRYQITGPLIVGTGNYESISLTADQADGLPQVESTGLWFMQPFPDSIEFSVAQPGAYWLGATVPRKGFCAGPFTAAGINAAREPIQLSPLGSSQPMELVLRDDCSTLSLNLPANLTALVPGEEPFLTVYIVPDFDSPTDIAPMSMHPSSGPTLTLDSLTPGSYHVYTFSTPVHLEYRNPAALAALPNPGQQVTLSPSAPASLVLEVPAH
jgi:hypothetical protein